MALVDEFLHEFVADEELTANFHVDDVGLELLVALVDDEAFRLLEHLDEHVTVLVGPGHYGWKGAGEKPK